VDLFYCMRVAHLLQSANILKLDVSEKVNTPDWSQLTSSLLGAEFDCSRFDYLYKHWSHG
jgi:hypothetical protein